MHLEFVLVLGAHSYLELALASSLAVLGMSIAMSGTITRINQVIILIR